MTWKLSAIAPRPAIEAALEAAEDDTRWPAEITIAAAEVDEAADIWALECWLEEKPTPRHKHALAELFGADRPSVKTEKLPQTDWLVHSQQNTPPIRAGRFHVHTPDFPPLNQPGVTDFCIPAAQAFGTGQHATTSGCLAMLDMMKQQGVIAREVADIGSGTGLLAFAARALWPRARFVASDIDPLCADAVVSNAQANGIPVGIGRGQVTPLVATGMDDDLLDWRAPYDLLIANILAGPLIELAPDFAAATAPRAHILLSGLLITQEPAVRAAYRACGYRLHRRLHQGDWSILWLRRRFAG
jgi:ribosomal protein L11 methyltransferase